MGNNAIPARKHPTRESFHLGMARNAYLAGQIDIDEFEQCVSIVLAGGHLPHDVRRALGPPANASNRTTV